MLDGQQQRVDVSAYARNQDGLLQKILEESLCSIIPYVPQQPNYRLIIPHEQSNYC